MATQQLPVITNYIDQSWFLEPLKGDRHPNKYLDRFPEEVYNTGPDSVLGRFLYTILGPAGIGQVRQNALKARLALEDLGLELFDLNNFYANPFGIARLSEEVYDEDPNGLIDRAAWDKIRTQDARYRSRVADFLDGARAGNTPLGIYHVARSGLGHEVEVVENYKFLFDEHSDDPMGLPNYGKTRCTEEFIVLPRREIVLSEVQVITIYGEPTGGFWKAIFNGEESDNIGWDANAANLRTILEDLPSILPGDIEITGGPSEGEGPTTDNPYRIRFMGTWSARNVPQIRADISGLTGGTDVAAQSSTEQSGVDEADEVAYISDRDQHHLQEALDRIRPVNTIPTVGAAEGLRSRQLWQRAQATSEYDEVIRFVTGNPSVHWPPRDKVLWIESGVEHQSPRADFDLQYQYKGFHNVVGAKAYTDAALDDPDYLTADIDTVIATHKSEHIGPFNAVQRVVVPALSGYNVDSRFYADMVTADYAEPLTVRSVLQDGDDETVAPLVNGIYPTQYTDLPGVPTIKYADTQMWASREREEGTEYIEIDLGSVQAVNYLSFETTRKPFDIEVHFDRLGFPSRRVFEPVVFHPVSSSRVINFAPEDTNVWTTVEFLFGNGLGDIIFTRFLRIGFTRRNNPFSPFAINGGEDGYQPWSIEARNLRVGRNVTNLSS